MPGQFVDSIINENLKVATEYFKATSSDLEKNPDSGGIIGFIPFKMSCILDGISGIKIYNELNVNTNFLPTKYTKTTKFIVTGVDHKLSNGDWETSLNLTLIPNASNIGIITREIVLAKRNKEVKSAPTNNSSGSKKIEFEFTSGTFIENLVKICEHERELWENGKIKESNPPEGHGDYSPRSKDAWSGRFISWCVNTAGKDIWSSTTPRFGDYQRHSGYSNKAKTNRRDDVGYFKAYRYNEIAVQVGDILVYSRQGGTWDTNGYDTPYSGHGDICTKIEGNIAYCIGGNLSDSVRYAKYALDSDNKLKVSGKPTGFYTGEGSPKDVFQTIIRFNLP